MNEHEGAPSTEGRPAMTVVERLVARWIAAFNAHDWDALRSLYRDDYVGLDHRPSPSQTLDASATTAGWRMLAEVWPGWRAWAEVVEQTETVFWARAGGEGAGGAAMRLAYAGVIDGGGCRVRDECFDQEDAAAAAFARLCGAPRRRG